MRIIDIINYVIIVLYITLFVLSFMSLLKIKMTLERRIVKIAVNIFLLLLIWSIYRFVNKVPAVNIYDYLIIILNGGLFIISIYNSRNIK